MNPNGVIQRMKSLHVEKLIQIYCHFIFAKRYKNHKYLCITIEQHNEIIFYRIPPLHHPRIGRLL